MNCQKCKAIDKLPSGCSPTPGSGPKNTKLMFINDRSDLISCSLAEPFSTNDGDFLFKILKDLSIDKKTCYFTSLVKCTEYSIGNARTCFNWLLEEISEIKPEYIISLGERTAMFLLPKNLEYKNCLFQTYNNILVAPSLHKLLNGPSADVRLFKRKLKEFYGIS